MCARRLCILLSPSSATMYRLPSVMSPRDRTTGIYSQGFHPSLLSHHLFLSFGMFPPVLRFLHRNTFHGRNVSRRETRLIPKDVPWIRMTDRWTRKLLFHPLAWKGTIILACNERFHFMHVLIGEENFSRQSLNFSALKDREKFEYGKKYCGNLIIWILFERNVN